MNIHLDDRNWIPLETSTVIEEQLNARLSLSPVQTEEHFDMSLRQIPFIIKSCLTREKYYTKRLNKIFANTRLIEKQEFIQHYAEYQDYVYIIHIYKNISNKNVGSTKT